MGIPRDGGGHIEHFLDACGISQAEFLPGNPSCEKSVVRVVGPLALWGVQGQVQRSISRPGVLTPVRLET